MSDIDIHALVGAYALDAVDDLERVAFERHLAGCEACRTEADELRETAARLADSTWSVPPPRLRTEVLAAVGQTRQLGPGQARPERDARAAVSRWRRFTAGAAAAAILAAGAGAATWSVQEQRVRDKSADVAAAQLQQSRIQAVLGSSDLVVRTSPMAGGGKLTVAYSAARKSSVVSVAAYASPGTDRSFQMWTVNGAVKVNAGVLPAGAKSALTIIDGLPGNDGFAVSLEKAGGVQQPTDVVAKVDLV
jgi:anti-sigma factor RsiW